MVKLESRLMTLAATVLIVGALYFARELLIPLALAVLFSFMLAPLATRVQRWGLGRVPSVIGVVGVTACGVVLAGWVVGQQMYEVAQDLPRYRQNVISKLDALRQSLGPALTRVTFLATEIDEHLKAQETRRKRERRPDNTAAEQVEEMADEELPVSDPVPVRVVETPISIPSILSDYVGPILSPLASVFLVAVLVIFMLIQREDTRNRIIRLVGASQLRLTTQAIDDANKRVSRYLVMQLLINSIYGLAVSVGLYFIGLPNPVLWGMLATVLRFVPYIGPLVGAALPLLLSIAVFEGWGRPLVVLGWLVALELVTNNVLEPWLYHSSTGVSPLGVIVSAVFWTWLWGGVGLVLAMPLTVCLTVLGRHVPQFRFVYILLGDEPPLPPGAMHYQRLLASDQDESDAQVKEFLKKHAVIELYDEVLLPALRLAEEDRHAGQLEAHRLGFIHAAIRDTLDDVESDIIAQASEEVTDADAAPPNDVAKAKQAPRIVCISAHDDADEMGAVMLGQLLGMEGCETEILPASDLTASAMDTRLLEKADVIWISAVPPVAEMHARRLVKRLRTRCRGNLLVGLWTGPTSKRGGEQIVRSGAVNVVATLAEAVFETMQLINPAVVSDGVNENAADGSEKRVSAAVAS